MYPEVIKVNYLSVVMPAEELYRPGDEVVSITTSIGDMWVSCDGGCVQASSASDGSGDDSGPGNEGLFITPNGDDDRDDEPDGRDGRDRDHDEGMEAKETPEKRHRRARRCRAFRLADRAASLRYVPSHLMTVVCEHPSARAISLLLALGFLFL